MSDMVEKAVNSPAHSRKSSTDSAIRLMHRDQPRKMSAVINLHSGHSSPVHSRKSSIVSLRQPRDSPRRMSAVSDLGSLKSSTLSTAASSEATLESGYETITDVVCKGPLLYYKPRWFGESWKRYDAVLSRDGVLRWFKIAGSEDAGQLEGTLLLHSIPSGLITVGKHTEKIPQEQQVRLPREVTFATAIAIGEPQTSGEVFWFVCPSTEMLGVWEQGLREVVAAEKFSAGCTVYPAWMKYSPEPPADEREKNKEASWTDGFGYALFM